jgi:hypothetical protein
MSYSARLEGHPDFALEVSSIKIEPGKTARLGVRWGQRASCVRSILRMQYGSTLMQLVAQLMRSWLVGIMHVCVCSRTGL